VCGNNNNNNNGLDNRKSFTFLAARREKEKKEAFDMKRYTKSNVERLLPEGLASVTSLFGIHKIYG